MPKPLLSVVIPTWNRGHIVSDAIESALAQKAGEVEVIIVDDGSSDCTSGSLTRRFGSQVHLLKMPVRSGPGAARNAGAQIASGEMIAFLDSDDLWLPGKLDAELAALSQFRGANAIVSDSLGFLEGRPDARTRFDSNGLLGAANGRTRLLSDLRWPWTNPENGVATCSITLHRSSLDRFSGKLFAEDLVYCEDWEFELKVYRFCRVVVLPQVLSHLRRIDDGSRVGRALPGRARTLEQERSLLRSRLTVMHRADWLAGIDAQLSDELERCKLDNARKLAQLEGTESNRNLTAAGD